MVTNIDDRNSKYQQALTAYQKRDYEVAARLIDQAVHNLPSDPHSRLLRGHIYYALEQFNIAKAEYENVFDLTEDQEIITSAVNYLKTIKQSLCDVGEDESAFESIDIINSVEASNGMVNDYLDLVDLGVIRDLDQTNFDLKPFGYYEASQYYLEGISLSNHFTSDLDRIIDIDTQDNSIDFSDDPLALNQPFSELETTSNDPEPSEDLELPSFSQEGISSQENTGISPENIYLSYVDTNSEPEISRTSEDQTNSPFLGEINLSGDNNWQSTPELIIEQESPELETIRLESFNFVNNSQEDINVTIAEEDNNLDLARNDLKDIKDKDINTNTTWSSTNNLKEKITEEFKPTAEPNTNTQTPPVKDNLSDDEEFKDLDTKLDFHESDDDYFDLEAFESAFGSENFTTDEESNAIVSGENYGNDSSAAVTENIEFLGNFEDFDDLGNIPSFDIPEETDHQDTSVSAEIRETSNSNNRSFAKDVLINSTDDDIDTDEEILTITSDQEPVPVFTPSDVSTLEPNINVEQGLFAFFENASLETKQWYIASTVGLTSAMAAALISFGVTTFSQPEQRESVRNTGWVIALSAGLTAAITSGFMGNLAFRQVRRTTKDLQSQFDAVRQGHLNVQATVYSEDELGYLATSFNDMARVIFMTTNEAQRKAEEQEEAKENLQREVIRLLDDAEGVARGDLTVQGEVKADVLGAVGDACNLTIQNLRDIVQQVKIAAREVTKGISNSETFAKTLSGDALGQAEKLAVTLNSVQVMTESIKRVADAAKEAEVIAHNANLIALKGGEAVENTVVGILEIRETVAETTRKVKRLAESSQEINSIVALVSQIASRTNLLALNASIEVAKAGEAGTGFAIVADEVRQLAHKSAKSLKEIEEIVMQIQSETSSVMTAMEEGTQQVIKGTKLAEEAKRSLDDIIQVAGHIDSLVCSITADTVEQTETSLAVAQVMQSVELTAQETSQEAQRVSGELQHLVRVSRDLIASVERFR